jgi:hypothetical protein
MDDRLIQPLIWTGLALAIVAIFMSLEFLLRWLTNRFATAQDRQPGRVGTQLPRVLR